jgi:hypothetical protein
MADNGQPTPEVAFKARLFRSGLILFLFLVPTLLAGSLYFGSFTALLSFLCGRPLLAEYSGELGDVRPGAPRTVTVKITNLTWGDMEISGASASCSCVESISPQNRVRQRFTSLLCYI